jgi:F0F1-type ATP synthase assembly protein I
VLIWCASMAQDSLRGDADRAPTRGNGPGSPSEAWTILSHLITGLLVFSLAGWGLDTLLGTRWLLLVGLLFGLGASFALIYIRYLYVPPDPLPRPGGPAGPEDRKEQHG